MSVVSKSETWTKPYLSNLQRQLSSHLYHEQRNQLNDFLRLGFPNRFSEDWKYTNVSKLQKENFLFADRTVFHADDLFNQFVMDVHPRIVFVNGFFNAELSTINELKDVVEFLPIVEALKNDAFKEAVFSLFPEYQTPFSFLNGALFQDGFFIRVKRDVVLPIPINLFYWTDANLYDAPLMSQIRHFIVLEDYASVSIAEHYAGKDDYFYFNNIVNRVRVGVGARLNWYSRQSEGCAGYHIANTTFQQKQASHVSSYHVGLGGLLSRDNLSFSLEEPEATAELWGLYFGRGRQHIDYHTRIDHRASHCKSHQVYKGILHDASRAVFNGKIKVEQHSDKTYAHQANHNLLLSNQVRIDTKPELEIYHDDVSCVHAATVGQLEKTALFYLCSRGIPLLLAKKILVDAFVEDIFEHLPDGDLSNRIKADWLCHLGCLDIGLSD